MSKSKNNATTTVTEEVVETPVETSSETPVETTDETVVETPTEAVEETTVEEVVETPAETETKTESETSAETTSEEVVETPADSETPAETETSDKELSDHERDVKASEEFMSKTYNVRYAPDTNSKRFAVSKTMTMFEIYNMFVNKRTRYVALTSNEDFNYVRDFFNEHPVYYYNVEVGPIARVQFLNRLKSYTDYAVVRWGKK